MKTAQTDIRVRLRDLKTATVSVTVEGQNAGVFEGAPADAWAFVAALALQTKQGFEQLAAKRVADGIIAERSAE